MVKVYSKPNCANCTQAKNVLKFNKVEFEEVDVTQDEEAFAHIKSLGAQVMPVVEFGDGTHLLGFNRLSLMQKLSELK